MKAREINQKMRNIMNTKTGLKAVGVFAVYLIITLIINAIGSLLKEYQALHITFVCLVSILVLPVLSLGYKKYYLDITRGKRVSIYTLFEGFTKRYLYKTVLTWLMIVIISIAFLLFVGLIQTMLISPFQPIVFALMVHMIVLFIILWCVTMISQITFRIIDNPSDSSWKAIKSSSIMMDGRFLNFLLQHLALLPLYILPFIVFGVLFRDWPTPPNYLVLPYVTMLVSYSSPITILKFITTIILLLLIYPRITMSLAIWYDDRARNAKLEIEE